jgi:hypothetical protein
VSNFIIVIYCILTSLIFVWNLFVFYKINDERVTLGSLVLSLVSFIPVANLLFTILLLIDSIAKCVFEDEFDKLLELADITLYEKDKADE